MTCLFLKMMSRDFNTTKSLNRFNEHVSQQKQKEAGGKEERWEELLLNVTSESVWANESGNKGRCNRSLLMIYTVKTQCVGYHRTDMLLVRFNV